MRNLSAAALAQVTANLGGEPLVVVAAYWDGVHPMYYCDRGAFQSEPQLQGKILEMGSLEDVVNYSGSATSQSVTIKLDDTDETIKAIFNVIDIHKKPVIIYQWFSQLNFNDKFIIFEAVINSPIVWSEKDRTFTFDVVSKLEDAEIGYSPEEGDFPELNDEIIGKPWPLPFGTVFKVPPIRLDILPNAITMDTFGLHDPSLDYQINNLLNKAIFTQSAGIAMIIEGGYLMPFGFGNNTSADQNDNTATIIPIVNPATANNQNNATPPQTPTLPDSVPSSDAPTVSTTGQTTSGTGEPPLIQSQPPPSTASADPTIASGGGSGQDTSGSGGSLGSVSGSFADIDAAIGDPDNTPGAKQAQAMIDAGNKLLAESLKMIRDAGKLGQQRSDQIKYEVKSIRLFNGKTFPPGTHTFEIGNLIIVGNVVPIAGANAGADSILNIQTISRKTPLKFETSGGNYAQYNQTGQRVLLTPLEVRIISGGGFEFQQAGASVKMLDFLFTRYIAAMLPCVVLGVYALYDYGSAKIMTAVPTNYYTVSYPNFDNDPDVPYLTATQITLPNPLSFYNSVNPLNNTGPGINNSGTNVINTALNPNAAANLFQSVTNNGVPSGGTGWSDEIYVDMISPVGPNTIGILEWLIGTYTKFGWDITSFDTVSEQLANFPMNFCLFERKNIIDILKEIAFQAKCAIFLKENLFYLLYLVPQPTPVDAITLDDIIYQSLELHHSPTEQIVTKFVANYKIYYGVPTGFEASDIASKQDKIILRNNIPKYGLHEQQYSYYAYTDPGSVDLSATFWLIRKSNTWKILKFKTPLHKLKLETYDAVTINFAHNWSSNGPVVGLIQSAHLDTSAMEIEFEVWLPVRLGEMTQYDFAWPVDSTFFFYPLITDQAGSGGPGAATHGNLTSTVNPNGVTVSFPKGGRKSLDHGNPNPGATAPDDPITTPESQPSFTQPIGPTDITPPPVYPPVALQYDVSSPNTINNPLDVNKSIPAKIVSANELPKYRVEAFPYGLDNESIITGAIDATWDADTNSSEIAVGTWVMISNLIWFEYDGSGVKFQKRKRYFVPGSGGSSTFPGVVTGGSGNTYTMNIYKTGTGGPPTSVTVKQLQINSDTIPNGTWALVAQGKKFNPTPDEDPNEYTMQVPVWI